MSDRTVRALALENFTAYFSENYPGPNTIISDPKWHAPKIFKAAENSIKVANEAAVQPQTVSDPTSVCLRIDHMHRKELGCWEYRPISERRKEAESAGAIVGKIEGLSARLISESCQADYCYCEGCGVRRKVASELRAIVGQNKT